jgi:catalase
MTNEEKARLIRNIANSMRGIPEHIIKLQLRHFTKADPAYGGGVAEALGVAAPQEELAAIK